MTRSVTLAGYAVVVAVAVLVELAARRRESSRLARAGEAVRLVLGVAAVRVLVGAGWLWLGWHLFVRTDWR